MDKQQHKQDNHRNLDPITQAPGAHPLGTGVGAVAGGVAGVGAAVATGAVIGSGGGPIGTAVGAVIGAVAGGLIGKGVAEGMSPTAEAAYWENTYATRPYVEAGRTYDDYGPAYQYGWESHQQHKAGHFDDVEARLGKDWDRVKGQSKLKWEQAKHATKDAWNKIHGDKA